MSRIPNTLKKGDKIAVVCSAGFADFEKYSFGIKVLESWGLEVVVSNNVYEQFGMFSGNDTIRTQSVQQFLDDDNIKAIIFGRGGYGTIRIIDQLDFTKFNKNPKWLIGYSDLTILLNHVQNNFDIQSIHGPMLLGMDELNAESLNQLKSILFDNKMSYSSTEMNNLDKTGNAEGVLVGGNLSVWNQMTGSDSMPNMDGKILFIEDLSEQLYHIDRMLFQLKRNGTLSKINGLIIGSFTEIRGTKKDFGYSLEEIFKQHTEELDIPIWYNFSAGHDKTNTPLIIGSTIKLSVEKNQKSIKIVKTLA